MEDRIISSEVDPGELSLEQSLRPQYLKQYIGQEKVKANLRCYIEAAKMREETLDHVLLYGPPGLGKTTLAAIIANEMGVNIRTTSGPAIERPGDLAAILSALEPGDVLFIDEIHRLPRSVEEVLYPAMEDFCLDIVIGKGPTARSVRIDLPPFTLVGATTRAGSLSAPLRDRFGVLSRLEYYTEPIAGNRHADSWIIGNRNGFNTQQGKWRGGLAVHLGLPIDCYKESVILPKFAEMVQLQMNMADYALELIQVDRLGLDHIDHKLLKAIIEKFRGGPVGLETIAATIGEESHTIEDVYEPYFLQIGFLQRTPRGRIVTELAYQHLELEVHDH